LLTLDTRDDSYRLIPQAPEMKPWAVGIFFSGLERSLAGSRFNMRVDECRSAAYSLMAFAGMEYGKFPQANLRDVPYEVFLQYRDRLPEPFAKRATHFYSEQQRVERGIKAWEQGDLEAFGQLCFESGHSSIDHYETGSAELKGLYEIMLETDGIYGGRFSGAGFKGCCMALIDPAKQAQIEAFVTEAYLKKFPEMTGKFSVHFCKTANGLKALQEESL
jgi:galactokinase/galacturonokinase